VILPKHHGKVEPTANPDLPRRLQAAEKKPRASPSNRHRPTRIPETKQMPAKIIQRNKKPMKKVKVDSVTIDIIESALRNARYEMDTVLFRTAMSPGIREQHERVPHDRQPRRQDGRRPVRLVHLGLHAGYDGTVEEGDIFLTNDPYSVNGAITTRTTG